VDEGVALLRGQLLRHGCRLLPRRFSKVRSAAGKPSSHPPPPVRKEQTNVLEQFFFLTHFKTK
jgi:hypothetical protein